MIHEAVCNQRKEHAGCVPGADWASAVLLIVVKFCR